MSVRVMERVTGMFRIAAHEWGLFLNNLVRALVSDTVFSTVVTQAVVDPLKAGSGRCRQQRIAAVYCDAMGSDGQNSYKASPFAPILYHRPSLQLSSIKV